MLPLAQDIKTAEPWGLPASTVPSDSSLWCWSTKGPHSEPRALLSLGDSSRHGQAAEDCSRGPPGVFHSPKTYELPECRDQHIPTWLYTTTVCGQVPGFPENQLLGSLKSCCGQKWSLEMELS